MTKQRYIDFAPVKKKPSMGAGTSGGSRGTSGAARGATGVARPAARPVAAKKDSSALTVRKGAPRRVVAKKPVVRRPAPEEVAVEEIFEERVRPAGVSRGLKEPAYGVIEDYQPKFVQAEVKKRPLGAAKSASAVRPQAQKKTAPKPAGGLSGVKFLNTNKIEKRPLSATNTIARKTAVPKEVVTEEKKKSKGPERIIAKPDKDSKAGLIIAVILTIILGAAAGTVAFLLLPK